MTAPFISTADLGFYMGQDLSSDDLAAIAIDAACEAVRTYLNRPLNLTTLTETRDGTGTDALGLRYTPIVNVDTVTVDDTALTDDDYVIGDHALYRVGSWWPPGRRNVTVVYTGGYAVTEAEVGADSGDVGVIIRMPSDIREVALELAKGVVVSGSSAVASGALTGETIGDYSYTVDAATAIGSSGGSFNALQRARLAPYRYRPHA